MNEELPTIDRRLLRLDKFDGHVEPQAVPSPPSQQQSRIDITAILETIQHTATSMIAMAERISELEAHAQAFEAANNDLDAQNRRLNLEVSEIIQQRDNLTAGLEAEGRRLQQLESDTAWHVARANALEHDLSATHASLTKIIDAVEARWR